MKTDEITRGAADSYASGAMVGLTQIDAVGVRAALADAYIAGVESRAANLTADEVVALRWLIDEASHRVGRISLAHDVIGRLIAAAEARR